MIVIGLTGGIATGKTTVSRMLAELGAVVLDADEVGHEALKPHTEVWRNVVARFGNGILLSSGEVDRRRLGEVVFSDDEVRENLNQIMHPPMYRMVEERLGNLRKQDVGVVVLEAAVLLEAEWTSLVDKVWVTTAPEDTVVQRLKDEKGLSEAQALARIGTQLSPEERVKRADAVIDTNCDLTEVRARVEVLWRDLHREMEKS